MVVELDHLKLLFHPNLQHLPRQVNRHISWDLKVTSWCWELKDILNILKRYSRIVNQSLFFFRIGGREKKDDFWLTHGNLTPQFLPIRVESNTMCDLPACGHFPPLYSRRRQLWVYGLNFDWLIWIYLFVLDSSINYVEPWNSPIPSKYIYSYLFFRLRKNRPVWVVSVLEK